MADSKRGSLDISLSRETLSGTAAQIVVTLIGFAGTIIFARVLGPTNFGLYFILVALSEVGARLLTGWGTAAKKRFSEDISEVQRSQVFGAQILVTGGILASVLITTLVIYILVGDAFNMEEAPLLFSVLLVSRGLYQSLSQTAHARGKIATTSWIASPKSVLETGLQIGLVIAGFGVVGMVIGSGVAFLIACIPLVYIIDSRPSIPDLETVKSLMQYGKYSIPNTLFGELYNRFDVLILGVLVGPAASGLYGVVYRITLPATFVSTMAATTLMVRVSDRYSRGIVPTTDIRNTISFAPILSIPLLLGSLALADDVVITFYGSDYESAAPLLIGLALFQVIRTMAQPLQQTLYGMDRPGVFTRYITIAAVLNFVLGVILTLQYGPLGVVAATIVAELAKYYGIFSHIRNELPMRILFPPLLFKQIGAAAIMLVVVSSIRELLPIMSTVNLVVVVSVGATIYFAILFGLSHQLRQTVAVVITP